MHSRTAPETPAFAATIVTWELSSRRVSIGLLTGWCLGYGHVTGGEEPRAPSHPGIIDVDTADGADYLSAKLNVSEVTGGGLSGSPLTEDTNSAARDPERLLDDELGIRVNYSAILPAITPHVLFCRILSVWVVLGGRRGLAWLDRAGAVVPGPDDVTASGAAAWRGPARFVLL